MIVRMLKFSIKEFVMFFFFKAFICLITIVNTSTGARVFYQFQFTTLPLGEYLLLLGFVSILLWFITHL